MSAPEHQAASNVLESLTQQQQQELINFAESLLIDNKEFNSDVRQRALSAISEASNRTASVGDDASSAASAASAACATSGNVDIDKVTDAVLPFAQARIPESVRQQMIVRLREMLLNH